MRAVQANHPKAQTRHRAQIAILTADVDFRALVMAACRKRDISVVGYVRRAVARQIAKDLNLPFEEVCLNFPAPSALGRRTYEIVVSGPPPDDGTGFGDWNN